MVDLGFMGNTNNNPNLASGFSKILKNNPLTSGQTKSTNSLLSQVKNMPPVSEMGKEEQPQMENQTPAIPNFIGNLKNGGIFLKELPQIKTTMPNYIQPIGGINAPVVGSQFGTIKGAENTMISAMSDEAKQGIKKDVAAMNFQRKDLDDLKIDVDAGMPKEEMGNMYPEIPEAIRDDLYEDIKAGIPLQDVGTYYPELSGVGGIQASEVEGKNPILRGVGAIRGGVKGAAEGLYEGVVKGAGEMAQDVKRIRQDKSLTSGEKFAQTIIGEFGMNYLGGIIGDFVGGTVGGAFKGFTTETERKWLSQKGGKLVKDMIETAKTNPDIDNIIKKYDKLPENEKQHLNDLVSYAVDATNFIGAKELAQPVLEGGKAVIKAGIKEVSTLAGYADDILAKLPKKAITTAEKQAIIDATPKVADKMIDNMHGFTKAEIRKYRAKYGETPGQTLNNEGLIASSENTLETKVSDLQKFKADKRAGLSEIKTPIPADDDVIQMTKEVAEHEKSVATPSELKAEDATRKKYEDYVSKAENGELSHAELDEIKSNFERNKALKYDASRTTTEQARLKNLDSAVRTKQQKRAAENGFDNIKDINQQISKSKAIVDMLAKDVEKIGGLSFPDYVLLAESVVSPSTLGILVGKKLIQTGRFKRQGVKVLNRLNGKTNVLEKAADLRKIRQINSEQELKKLIETPALPHVGSEKTPIELGEPLPTKEPNALLNNRSNTPDNRVLGTEAKIENPLSKTEVPETKQVGKVTQNPLLKDDFGAMKNVKHTDDIKKVEAVYSEVRPFLEKENKQFISKLEQINKEVGGKGFAPGPIKEPNSIHSKMIRKGYTMADINDFVRGTIKYDTKEALNKIVQKFGKMEGFENRTTAQAIKDNMGYQDLQIVYKLKSGIKGELQFNTPDMIFAKDGAKAVEYGLLTKEEYAALKSKYGEAGGEGHKYYDQVKKIKSNIKKGKISAYEAERQIQEITNKSIKYYDRFRTV